MIIKRLATGIKEQDWFVVTVEVMIVVIGIFIGLQVDGWNQERQNRMDEGLFLKRLQSDLKDSIDVQTFHMELYDKSRDSFQIVLDILRTGKMDDNQKEKFELGLLEGLRTPTFYFNRTTINELKTTGNLNLIKDISLRNEMGKIDSRYDNHLSVTDGHVRAMMRNFSLIFNKYVQIIDATSETPKVNYNFEEIVASREVYKTALNLQHRYDLLILFNKEFHEATLNYKERLDAVTPGGN